MSSGGINHWDKAFGGNIAPDDRLAQLIEAVNKKQQQQWPVHTPVPKADPFVFASQVAANQPTDRSWRLFQGVLFRIEDVRSVHPNGTDGGFTLKLVNGQHEFSLPIVCDNPTRWFSEHVLSLDFQRAEPK